MEKSGQGHSPRNNPLIIDRPDLQSWQQMLVSRLLTTIFWALWVVLWLPLVTLAGWAFFGLQFHFHFLELDGYAGFLDLLTYYALVIAGLGGALIVWAKYNHLRFRGMDRRKAAVPVTLEALAWPSGHPASELRNWQQLRIMTVHHDAHGRIDHVVNAGPFQPMREGTGRAA